MPIGDPYTGPPEAYLHTDKETGCLPADQQKALAYFNGGDLAILHGIGEETQTVKSAAFTFEEIFGPEKKPINPIRVYLQIQPDGRFNYRAEHMEGDRLDYLRIENAGLEKIWTVQDGTVKESNLTITFDEYYELQMRSYLSVYIETLSRWDGKNDIKMYHAPATANYTLSDILINPELDQALFEAPAK
jgi:hypothetical protein